MLKLNNISKIYKTDGFSQKALNQVSISFRENEFVSILGPSGSGKTTLLNIIGGLDNYDSGNLIINGVSTKSYKSKDWDIYRNHKVGFVFQSYNLIPHQSIIANVELALTLSGVGKAERKRRAKQALKRVGLEKHINKRPNQLSGGQMQRVAIARALVNNPDILLADEPTGALDSKTSKQIMDLLKEVANEKLVIMVTHNPELATEYSTRIIKLQDGKILEDTNPAGDEIEEIKKSKSKKTNMSFLTALSLSLNNLMTKKGRTILTSAAGSIGIIGIALILSLSNGVQKYIDRVQEETLTSYPLTIEKTSVDYSTFIPTKAERNSKKDGMIYSNNTITNMLSSVSNNVTTNNLEDFKKYIEDEKKFKEYTTAISYSYGLNLNIYKYDDDGYTQVEPDTVMETLNMNNNMYSFGNVWNKMFDNETLNRQMYTVVSGKMPDKYNEVVILVDEDETITDYVLYALGLKNQEELKNLYNKVVSGEKVESTDDYYDYNDFLNLNYKLVLNTDYYEKQNGLWIDKSENDKYMRSILKDAEDIKVVGIIKPNKDSAISTNTLGGVLYTKDLEEYIINKISNKDIVKEQKEKKNINVLTGKEFGENKFDQNTLSTEEKAYLSSLTSEELAAYISNYNENANATYENNLAKFGAVNIENPTSISLYPKDFDSKDEIKNLIKSYNNEKKEEDKITYNDLVGILMNSVTNIVQMISYVLIGFVSISLVVSSIMIGIITYISVLERTKEIGILRAIGASKKDISRVFNAETLIIGFISGVLGIVVTILLNIPINMIIESIANVKKITSLPIYGAIILIIISIVLTLIGGLIPAKLASKKDPVEALRTE